MVRLNPTQFAFLQRFAKTPDARALIDVLVAERGGCEQRLLTLEGAEMHRQQGRAALLDELIANIGGTAQKSNQGNVKTLRFSNGPLE